MAAEKSAEDAKEEMAEKVKTLSDNDLEELLKADQGREPEPGCWEGVANLIGGLWSTRELQSKVDRESYVRTTIRELVVYCIFLFTLCLVTFGMTSTVMFYYTEVMSSLFRSAEKVHTVEDLWKVDNQYIAHFMETDMLDGLYWEYMYNSGSQHKHFACPDGQEVIGPCPVAPSDRNILYENRLLGLPRMRQVRVRNDSCEVHEDFKNAINECFDVYAEHIEDKNPFGSGYRDKTLARAYRYITLLLIWMYNTGETLGSASFSGLLGTYSGAGSVQDLHSLKNESLSIVQELKEGLWIGRGTRLVVVDFTVYNANINMFCIVTLSFEMPATGGVLAHTVFRTVKLLRYVTAWDYFILACEMIFIVFIAYYIIEELLEIRRHQWTYFASFWNWLDMIVILVSSVSVAFNAFTFFVVENILKDLLGEPDKFADFTFLGSWSRLTNNAVAICVFCAWIKLFKYISFNKTMTQLSSTLSRSAKDVTGFGVMFFIVFFAFAQLGYLLFGTQVKDFSTFSDAIFTLLRTILGDFNFHEIEAADRILGPIFFLTYVFFVFFVLLNMFLAIINDTYSEVKADIALQKNEFEIGDLLRRGYNNMMAAAGGSRSQTIDIENAIKLANSDGVVTYEEMRQNLKKCNFSDIEIEMLFSRYDSDGNMEFKAGETNVLLEALHHNNRVDDDDLVQPSEQRPLSGKQAREQRSALITGTDALASSMSGVGGEEFAVMGRRVDRMELSIGSIVSKIDAVLIKLEGMERAKAKRKAAMGKILDVFGEDNNEEDAEARRKRMEDTVRAELKNIDDSRPNTGAN